MRCQAPPDQRSILFSAASGPPVAGTRLFGLADGGNTHDYLLDRVDADRALQVLASVAPLPGSFSAGSHRLGRRAVRIRFAGNSRVHRVLDAELRERSQHPAHGRK